MLSEPLLFPIFCSVFSAHSVLKSEKPNTKSTESRGGAQNNAVRLQMRGTSGTPRRTKRSRYRCSLPGLAGFAGLRRTEPEVPRIGSRAFKERLRKNSSIAPRPKKEKRLQRKSNTEDSEDTEGTENPDTQLGNKYWLGLALSVFSLPLQYLFLAPVCQRMPMQKVEDSKHHDSLCLIERARASYDLRGRNLRVRSGALPQSDAGRAAPAQRLTL